MTRRWRVLVFFLLLLCLSISPGCERATEPSHVQITVLKGTPYERGFAHGERHAGLIQGLYSRLLSDSIFPFLNREQISIAPILKVYGQPEYLDGQFSYLMLLESGRHLYENYLPEAIREELRGLADGSGLPLDEIILLNTFVDTMMGFRAVVVFIKHIQTPRLVSLDFGEAIAADGVDNNGDGETDEDGEGRFSNVPSPRGLMTEVPADTTLRMRLQDRTLGGLACPDPRNLDPIGEMTVEARCVLDECVRPECLGQSHYGRDCYNEVALECIAPRLLLECFDPNCQEVPDPGCVNIDSVRIQMDDQLYVSGDPALQISLLETGDDDAAEAANENPHALFCREEIEVLFTPPGGLPPASTVALKIQAGDQSPVYSPEPFHHRTMRADWLTFTTAGSPAGHPTDASPCMPVANRGVADASAQPAGIAFAARGTATKTGDPLLAHHFALLDANVVHEHGAIFLHIPDEGFPHVTIGWTGLIWGFSGMNSEGLAYAVNPSDSLDNPLTGGMLEDIEKPENLLQLLASPDLEGLARVLYERRLLSYGTPVGVAGRIMLQELSTAEEARQWLYSQQATYGWNFLLADAGGALVAVEVDSGVKAAPPRDTDAPYADVDGFASYTPDSSLPENLDDCGEPWASVGPDDLRVASHFTKNTGDMFVGLGPFTLQPQRHWTGFYYRSVRTLHLLGDALAPRLGELDAEAAIAVLREPELVDKRDSMAAVVFEPAERRLYWALGQVPATDGEFTLYDLRAAIEEATR